VISRAASSARKAVAAPTSSMLTSARAGAFPGPWRAARRTREFPRRRASRAAPARRHGPGCPSVRARPRCSARRFPALPWRPHDVVVLNHHLAAVISHREQRSAVDHQRLGEMRHADEGPARHIERARETVAPDVDDPAAQRLLGREGDRVDEGVEPAPVLPDPLENGLHLAGLAHVQRHEDRCFELLRQRRDEFLRLLVEIGHRHVGAERPQPLGAAPGDRILVGDADHQRLAAFERGPYAFNRHAALAFRGRLSSVPARSARVWRAIICSSSVGIT